MPVATMLGQMSSVELTMWMQFLPAAHEREQEAIRRAREERDVMGDDTGSF